MGTYAILDPTGLVVNIVVWDGTSNYVPPSGCTMTRIDNVNPSPGVGWMLTGSSWIPPEPPVATADPQGFTIAILNSSASVSEKSYIMSQLPGMLAELGASGSTLIEAGWQIIEASGQLSSGTITTIKNLAVQYAIPIS